MATISGATQNFQNVDVILGSGHRVDAYDTAGVDLAWTEDRNTMSGGPDNKAVHVDNGSTMATITVTLKSNSRSIPYINAWIDAGDSRVVVLQDRNGTTRLAEARARTAQKAPMTFNGAANPVPFVINCPNLTGVQGNLLDS